MKYKPKKGQQIVVTDENTAEVVSGITATTRVEKRDVDKSSNISGKKPKGFRSRRSY